MQVIVFIFCSWTFISFGVFCSKWIDSIYKIKKASTSTWLQQCSFKTMLRNKCWNVWNHIVINFLLSFYKHNKYLIIVLRVQGKMYNETLKWRVVAKNRTNCSFGIFIIEHQHDRWFLEARDFLLSVPTYRNKFFVVIILVNN